MCHISRGAEISLFVIRGAEICITARASGMISGKLNYSRILMECKDIPGKEKCLILLLAKFLKVSQLQINAKDPFIAVLAVKGGM